MKVNRPKVTGPLITASESKVVGTGSSKADAKKAPAGQEAALWASLSPELKLLIENWVRL